MIRELAIIFALGTSGVALGGVDSYAQTTDQTDKSEEDWRKSKKKRNSSDIFEDILNKNSIGQGTNQYPQNPIDILPEESRRHLMKERAKVIALSEPGKEADTPYTPSEAAKTDPELAEQEKEAWTVIMTDLKGGNTQGSGGTGDNKIAIAGQGGKQSGPNKQDNSPLRGGSSQSVADILAQIKGMKSSGAGGGGSVPAQQGSSGQGSYGQGPLGQGSRGQMPSRAGGAQQGSKGQSTSAQNGETGQQPSSQSDRGQGQSATAGQSQNSSPDAGQSQSAQNSAQTGAQNSSDAASSENDQSSKSAQNDTQAADATQEAAKAKTAPEPIGPLERIKRERAANSSGSHSSAADYLKKSKPED